MARTPPPVASIQDWGYASIDEMLSQGWTFYTLSEAMELDIRTVERIASRERRGRIDRSRQRACFLILQRQKEEAAQRL